MAFVWFNGNLLKYIFSDCIQNNFTPNEPPGETFIT